MVIIDSKLDALKKSAKEGRERAQYDLAQHHLKFKEYAAAVYWLQKAANQGFTLACKELPDVINNGMRRK